MGVTQGLTAGIRAALGMGDLASTAVVVPPPELGSPWVEDTHLQNVLVSELWGADLGLATRAQAMAVPAIARARTVLATTLARLPLLAMDGETAEAKELRAADGGLTPTGQFLAQPDPAQPRYVQLLWTVDDLVFSGVSWWLVLARYAAPSGQLGPVRNARRLLPGAVAIDAVGRPTVNGVVVRPDQLIRIDGPHEGILNYATTTVRTAARLESSAARFADNPTPSVELHQTDDTPMTPAQRRELVTGWISARKDPALAGVAFTTRNIEVKTHGAPAEHLLASGRNTAAIDAARVVGTPADSVDASVEHASMTYATTRDRLAVLIDFGLAAYGAAITARLSMPDVSPRGTWAGFAYDQITAATDSSVATPTPPAAPEPDAPASGPAGGHDQEGGQE